MLSPQEIALRIENTLRCVSIIIFFRKEGSIHYSVAVNTAGRHTSVSLIRKAFYDWDQCDLSFPKTWRTVCAHILSVDKRPLGSVFSARYHR